MSYSIHIYCDNGCVTENNTGEHDLAYAERAAKNDGWSIPSRGRHLCPACTAKGKTADAPAATSAYAPEQQFFALVKVAKPQAISTSTS